METSNTKGEDSLTQVAAACSWKNGYVLLSRRDYPPSLKDCFEFPGGKVEPGETPERALVREVWEELRCEARILELLHSQVNIHPPDPKRYWILFYLVEFLGNVPDHTLWVHHSRIEYYRVLPGVKAVVEKLREREGLKSP